MFRRSIALLAAAHLVACTAGPKPGDTDTDPGLPPDTDQPTDDTDDDTDTDVIVETDETDPDTLEDTGETDIVDSDTDVGSGLTTPIATTIHDIRQNTGGWATGQYLTISSAVVTAVRGGASSPRGFLVAETGRSTYGALWVDVPPNGTLPSVTSVVTLTGAYREHRPGSGTLVTDTQTQLQISAAFPNTSWFPSGSGTAPAAVDVTDTTFNANAEPYESMRINLSTNDIFELRADPDLTDNFPFGPSNQTWFFRALSLFGNVTTTRAFLGVDDTFSALVGYVWVDADGYAIAPSAPADMLGYLNYVPPDTDIPETDIFVETDTDSGLVVIETGETGDTTDTDPASQDATLEFLRAGVYRGSAGSVDLTIRDLVVTTVRAGDGVAVQDVGADATTGAGVYISLGGYSPYPAPGDVITVVGRYEEVPSGGLTMTNGYSVIRVGAGYPGSSLTVQSSGPRPAPIDIDKDAFKTAAGSEKYESMYVRVSGGFSVQTQPGAASREYSIAPTGGTPRIVVDPAFYNSTLDFAVTINDGLSAMSGVVWVENGTAYKLAPTRQADVEGWVDN